MASSYKVRLSDDILLMILKLVGKEDQAAFDDYLLKETAIVSRRWDDWGDRMIYEHSEWDHHLENYPIDGEIDDNPPRSTLLQALGVCKHWYSLLSKTPSMWTVLEISFREGAAALEHARTFLHRSESCPIQITILWDDPTWMLPLKEQDEVPPMSREEIMAGVHLGSVIQELYAHVHRWREFTLRTTSIAHTYQALSLIPRPSIHPAHKLQKLHLQFVHNPRHAAYHIGEPSLFPGSVPPIRNLLLFGISWAWPASSTLSSNLVDLRIHYDAYENSDGNNSRTGREAEILSQFLGTLVNLRTLALEVDLNSFDKDAIKLPHLNSLAIKSGSMPSWAVKFIQNVKMPVLRILTLCKASRYGSNLNCLIHELVKHTDPENSEDPLELNELHLINFETFDLDSDVLRRLYIQISTVETLTLGPVNKRPVRRLQNIPLAMGLLPTSGGLSDLPLPRLRSLTVFDIPEQLLRRIVLERQSLAIPLEELHCHYDEGDNPRAGDDWQHQVKKYNRINSLESVHYTDVVARRWTELMIRDKWKVATTNV
ncbi:hypothetical protein CY34DRAFT_810891 [Suillus luteus UH-Slu-Lm8-n1]|uniref:F-box domain-containing protein n=1 Tax=Suillus luteus UH-Slu-Lm8-n1 TaxID=930992 RepID=A0A0D0A5J0_9AGAM|nr:hypothetical protein CY34DRAFT_810891 [Suillus luteus UH-Slu-Lm8-n1]